MGWDLFTWILSAGIFSMLWLLYLSMTQDQSHSKPVPQFVRRHGRPQRRDNTIANA